MGADRKIHDKVDVIDALPHGHCVLTDEFEGGKVALAGSPVEGSHESVLQMIAQGMGKKVVCRPPHDGR